MVACLRRDVAGAVAAFASCECGGGGGAFCFAAAGKVRNDWGGVAVDRVAHPGRPLVTGAVDVRVARLLAAHLYALSLMCGWLAAGWWRSETE